MWHVAIHSSRWPPPFHHSPLLRQLTKQPLTVAPAASTEANLYILPPCYQVCHLSPDRWYWPHTLTSPPLINMCTLFRLHTREALSVSVRIVLWRMTQLRGARYEAAASWRDLPQIIFMKLRDSNDGSEKDERHGTAWDKEGAQTLCLCFLIVSNSPAPPGGLFQLFVTMSHSKNGAVHDHCFSHLADGRAEPRLRCGAEWAATPGHRGCLCERKLHSISNRNY